MTQAERGVALVTGGAVRVGRAISEALAAAGYHVVVNYHRSEEAAAEVVADAAAGGTRATAVAADVTDPVAAAELVATAERIGPIELLVNNAAVFERQRFLDLEQDAWRRHIDLNLEAPLRLSQLVARHMWERGHGRIVNICGTVGIEPRGEYAAYCVAKRGLDELTRCAAAALAPRVQVNGIAPGAIVFPEGTDDAEKARVLARVPAGRTGSPDDIASVVCYLADAPDYITGVIVPVDGGVSAQDG